MGATNCPETPRQRLIGMMYLVLTAMLALNVSKDILNAFVVVNEAMVKTTENFESKIDERYNQFNKAEEAEPGKVKEYNDKAKQIRKISKEFQDYIQNLKWEMHSKVDGIPVEVAKTKRLNDMGAKDNYSAPSTFFISPTYDGRAYEFHKKIIQYKEDIKKIINDPKFILPSGLDTEGPFQDNDGKKETWEQHHFDRIVAAAAYTLLNKFIGEVRNMEFEVVSYLFSAIDAESHKFDNVSAKVIPNSRIVFSGDKYEADIIVAAYDSRQDPKGHWKPGLDTAREDMIGSLTVIDGERGVVKLSIPTSAVGDQKFAGLIEIVGPDGKPQYHSFKSSYTVTKPSAAVAAEKMNVFYVGIPNPVSIAAPVAPEKLKINWGGATATSLGGGRYDVSVPNTLRDVTIIVSADVGSKTQEMGRTSFRVKTVPEPTVFIGANILGGRQPKEVLLANPLITARMSPDFNYELRWQILSYRVTFVRSGVEDPPISVTGAQFPEQVKQRIQSAPSGTNVEFTEIRISSIAGTRNITTPLIVRIR